MKEVALTEDTEAGIITYKYIVIRPSNPWIQLLNVSIEMPNGKMQDLTNGFFVGNDLILSEALKRKMLFNVKGE